MLHIMSLNHSVVARALPTITAIMAIGCTSIGMRDELALANIDFGPPETIQICVLREEGYISEDDADELMQAIRQEFDQYNIKVAVPLKQAWHRNGFDYMSIIEDLATYKLTSPCDRIFAFAGRHVSDFLLGLFGIEVLGAVEDDTRSRGFIFAEIGSINQIFLPPKPAAVHEAYHLLGCNHSLIMTDCYERIHTLKAIARKARKNSKDDLFFPSYNLEGNPILTREEVDYRLSQVSPMVQSEKLNVSTLTH